MDLFALDFDGVICDSARETALSAWFAGRVFWPEWQEQDPTDACLDRFVRLRPYLETGYQAVLMMRMITDGCPDRIFRDDLEATCERLIKELKTSKAELVQRFGEARDTWMARDLNDWLAANRPFPGTVEAVRAAMARHPVYILTTKQERFAQALLAAWGLAFPADRLFGLEAGRSKEKLLAELSVQHAGEPVRIHFVEDRVETLLRVAGDERLDAVRLYYAEWGYGTPEQLAQAQAHSRITVWREQDFLRID